MFQTVNYFIRIFCVNLRFIPNKSNEDNAYIISFVKKIKNFMYLNYFSFDLDLLLQTKMIAFALFRGRPGSNLSSFIKY